MDSPATTSSVNLAVARPALREALARFKNTQGRVSQVAAAEAMSAAGYPVTQQTISTWARRGWCQAEAVPTLSRLSGVPRWRLRPDLWDAPEAESDPTAAAAPGTKGEAA